MYESYWKLREKPFENTPNPRFIYYSQKHEEALSRMLYAIRERKGALILTGECGSGKTLLSRVLFEELSGEGYQSAVILNPILEPLDLLKEIIYQLGGESASLSAKMDLLHSLNEILYKNKNENKKTVILIDEAQAIPLQAFEELRLLLNFQLNDFFLFTLILLGQPELKEKMNTLPQLRQRFSMKYHLNALTPEQAKGYVLHRLMVAGAEKEIFEEGAFDKIYRFSGGVPRRINNVCDLALLVGSGEGLDQIDEKTIEEVAEDLRGNTIDSQEEAGSQLMVRISDILKKTGQKKAESERPPSEAPVLPPRPAPETKAQPDPVTFKEKPVSEEKQGPPPEKGVTIFETVMAKNKLLNEEECSGIVPRDLVSLVKEIYDKARAGKETIEADLEHVIVLVEKIADQQCLNNDNILNPMISSQSDDFLFQHAVNVAIVSMDVGLGLEYDKTALAELGFIAILHDIGMVKFKDLYGCPVD